MGVGQLIHDVKPHHISTFRPGIVGSIGEVIVKTRGRQSTPFMPWVYLPYWRGHRANKLGSNVQDGDILGYDNQGGPANVTNRYWNGNRSFKHQYGWTFHDRQSIDKITEPILTPLGDVSWRRKVARPRIIKRTGTLFNIAPGEFAPTGTVRGGNYPTSTSYGGIEPYAEAPTAPPQNNDPVTTGPYSSNELNAGPSRLGAQRGQGSRFENLRI